MSSVFHQGAPIKAYDELGGAALAGATLVAPLLLLSSTERLTNLILKNFTDGEIGIALEMKDKVNNPDHSVYPWIKIQPGDTVAFQSHMPPEWYIDGQTKVWAYASDPLVLPTKGKLVAYYWGN